MPNKTTAYWITTGLFCAVLAFSALAHLTRVEFIAASMTRLGYPLYTMTILGFAKSLGVVALLIPGYALLKEWAYAGFCFNLLAATASHTFAGDPVNEIIRPTLVLLLGAASYRLRPADRRIPTAAAGLV